MSPIEILYQVLGPVLLLVCAGAFLQRRIHIDTKPLATLQIRILVPAFLLVRLTESTLSWEDLSKVAIGIILVKVTMAGFILIIAKVLNLTKSLTFVLLITTCVFNAGNFGIPVAERTFGHNGAAVEAVVVLLSNVSLWGVGYALVSAQASTKKSWLRDYFSLPMPYAFLMAMLLKVSGIRFPEPIWSPISWCADAVIPVALITLGMQLAKQVRWPSIKFVTGVVVSKLILMPIAAVIICFLLGYWPWPAGQMILAASSPSAVNAVLLAIDQNTEVERTTDAVFWTTALSAITVPVVIWMLYSVGGKSLPLP